MKNSKYIIIAVLFLSAQVTFANSLEGSKPLFAKDGVLLVAILAIIGVFKLTQSLLSRE